MATNQNGTLVKKWLRRLKTDLVQDSISFVRKRLEELGVQDEKISCFSRTHFQPPDPIRCTFRMTRSGK